MAVELTPPSRRQIGLIALGAALGGTALLVGQSVFGPAREQRDVRAFGARGDGIHDDRSALQQAIDSGGDELWFPSGRYRLSGPLQPRSGQVWSGAGPSRSVLVYGGSPTKAPFNLLHLGSDGALEDFTLRDLGFWGGRSQQLHFSPQGQEGFALYLRCGLRAINILNCRFQHFGDGHSGGGGIVLGPRPEANGQGLQDLRIEGCDFADNGNVPGLYIATSHSPDNASRGITVKNNRFSGCVGSTKVQNCIYVLGGGPESLIRHVEISGNRFDLDTPIDIAIELNWIDTFTVNANTLLFQAAMQGSVGILIRDGSANGVVGSNVIVCDRADNDLRGILVLNFHHPQTIHNLVIADNVVSGLFAAIGADRGSIGLVIANNRISGTGSAGSSGIRIVDASAVAVSGNLISAMNQAVVMGVGDQPLSRLRNVVVERNRFEQCGGGGLALIGAIIPSARQKGAMTAVLIRDNTAVDSVDGSGQIDPALIADGGEP